MVALDWSEANASEKAWAAIAWGKVRVKTQCPGDGCIKEAWRGHGHTERTCESGTAPPECWALAWAESGPGWNKGVKSKAKCGGYAKGPFSAYDSVFGEASRISPDTFMVHIYGDLRTIHVNASAGFELIIYIADADSDTVIEDTLHYGKATLSGFEFTTFGFLNSGDFTYVSVEETTTASIDVQKYFQISEDLDSSIVVFLGGDTRAGYCQAPSLTQWGLIILVALLIGSGVFIMLRRRKVVPA